VIYARVALDTAFDETLDKYDQKNVISQGPAGQKTSDPLVTKGVLVPPVKPGDPVKGATNAQLTIIEYGDFQCPFCGQMAGVLDNILTTYPDTRLVWKDLPNPLHFEARPAALAARCAQNQNQDQFWAYHDLLFSNQDQLGEELYLSAAETLGLDLNSFTTCLNSDAYIELIGRGLDEANNYGVDGTPYLFVGSQRINQAVTFEELSRVVEQELTKSQEN